MILVLDACSISNLINVFQDNSLLIEIKKCFQKVYITPEVINEVNNNKAEFLEFYKNRWDDLDILYNALDLNDFVFKDDSGKNQCTSFLINFSREKKISFNEVDGEYHSTLLALYISRLGELDFAENTNKILFATDDLRAEDAYKILFDTNQVGKIIDSIDILLILYLKNKITKNKVTKYIEGLFSLYNRNINALLFTLKGVDLKNLTNSKQILITEKLREFIYDGNIEGLMSSIKDPQFRKYFTENKKVKASIEKLSNSIYQKKIMFLKSRKNEISKELIWKNYS